MGGDIYKERYVSRFTRTNQWHLLRYAGRSIGRIFSDLKEDERRRNPKAAVAPQETEAKSVAGPVWYDFQDCEWGVPSGPFQETTVSRSPPKNSQSPEEVQQLLLQVKAARKKAKE